MCEINADQITKSSYVHAAYIWVTFMQSILFTDDD